MSLAQYGIYREQGKEQEAIIYTTALLYNILNQRMTAYLKDYHLNPGKLNILVAIRHHGKKEGLRQVEISKHLILTPSNMTKMIDKLEKEGLVTRSALAGDRRVNIIQISDKAEKLLNSLWDGLQKVMKEMLEDLGSAKQKKLADSLTEWFEAMVR